MANKIVTVTTAATKSGDTVASYNVYTDKPSAGTLVGTMTPAEASAGKTLVFADSLNHNVTAKAVFTTSGESSLSSNIVVVDLSSTPWSLAAASYDSVSEDVSAITTSPRGIFFKPDGTKMYVTDDIARVTQEWTLSTAWDMSTKTLNVSDTTTSGNRAGLFFKPDGTKFYICKPTDMKINEWTLSTAWDITTAGSAAALTTSLSSMHDLHFSPDGLTVYFVRFGVSTVHQWTLSTAWTITSASATKTFDLSAQVSDVGGIYFKDDGTKMYIVSYTTPTIYEYNLATAWDIAAPTYTGNSLVINSENTIMNGLFIKPDGLKLYDAGRTIPANIFQYSLG